MKHCLVTLLTLFLGFPVLAQEIKIYTWDAFLSENVVNQFTKKTGHTVTQYFFDNEIERNAILMSGQGDKFDLILMDHLRAQEYGKLNKLRSLSNLNIANQQYNSIQSRNSCGQYGIPYAQGVMGIVHRKSVSLKQIDSWNDLLNPAPEHVGGTIMHKDDIDTTAIALIALGLDPFTEDKADLKKAYDLLTKQSDKIEQYAYPISYLTNATSTAKLSLSFAYSGDLFNIKKLSGYDDWEFVIPKEGTVLFVDCFSLPKLMAVKDATLAFISYINSPEIAAKNAQEMWFATTNEGALPLLSDEYKNDKELIQNPNQMSKTYQYKSTSNPAYILRNKMISMLHTKE
ncbi:spermidine/putrescine ABC transporter substrate-binding protein [Psychromonas sp. MME2]|uniref:polyamine ABC transporter substrate-binding protein n=1 Tax=unclassified Psychromonas TaxID=2614957 RepID=UPI00339C8849